MTRINTKDLMQIKTYAQSKGISVQAVYKQINQGKLKVIKIDGRAFVKREE